MSDENSKLVYSTDQPVSRKRGRAEEQKRGKGRVTSPENKTQQIRVRLDRKGRGGKSVTVIEGLLMSRKEKEMLLKQLKSGLGTGGTVRDTSLEIQGDRCSALMKMLEKMGYKPKRSGG